MACGPKICHALWITEMQSYVVPRIAMACGPKNFQLNVVPNTDIRIRSPQLASHMGSENYHGMWSPKLTLHVIHRTDLNRVQVKQINVHEGNEPSAPTENDVKKCFKVLTI